MVPSASGWHRVSRCSIAWRSVAGLPGGGSRRLVNAGAAITGLRPRAGRCWHASGRGGSASSRPSIESRRLDMRNWRSEVRRRLDGSDIAPGRLASIAEEVGQHFEQRYARLIAQGLPPGEAERVVLLELSDTDVVAREVRQIAHRTEPDATVFGGTRTPGRWLESVWQDVRYAVRTLGRAPGFTLVAVLTLALGIGANTAIFTVANAVMLRPLPFSEPDRLVRLWESNPVKGWPTFSASHPTFLDWRSESRSFERLAALVNVGFTLTSRDRAEIVRANAVTADFLPALGTALFLGRNFRPDEDRPGGHVTVAIATYSFWQRRLASNPAAIGTPLSLDGRPFDVIGVLPQ